MGWMLGIFYRKNYDFGRILSFSDFKFHGIVRIQNLFLKSQNAVTHHTPFG